MALQHLDEYIPSDEGFANETPYDVGPAEFFELCEKFGIYLYGFFSLLCVFYSL